MNKVFACKCNKKIKCIDALWVCMNFLFYRFLMLLTLNIRVFAKCGVTVKGILRSYVDNMLNDGVICSFSNHFIVALIFETF